MNNDIIKEITTRLYKAYRNVEIKEIKIFNVTNKTNDYNFKISINKDKKINLLEVTNGDFNQIDKIVKAIPFLSMLKNNGIEYKFM